MAKTEEANDDECDSEFKPTRSTESTQAATQNEKEPARTLTTGRQKTCYHLAKNLTELIFAS